MSASLAVGLPVRPKPSREMRAAPEANAFDERDQRTAVRRQRVDDRLRHPRAPPPNETVGAKLAQLLSEDFLRDAGHLAPQRGEVRRLLCEPVKDDHLPLAAHSCESRGQRAAGHWIAASGR